jgi:hypothetical protein
VSDHLKARCQYDRWTWTQVIIDHDSGSCTSHELSAVPSFSRSVESSLDCGLLSTHIES